MYNKGKIIETHREIPEMIKDNVLALLLSTDGFLSGEVMSEKLGVSRMTVSKAVATLREEGYDIASLTNRGYRLTRGAPRLTLGEILPYLPEKRAENVFCFDTIDSTNKRAKELAADGAPSGTVVISAAQTAGRGRRGRSFLSPKGKGVYLSYLFRPTCTPEDSTVLTALTAVAARRTILSACGLSVGIKWVNDLILNERKIAGILTELSLESESGHIDFAVIGIGINVSERREDFPEELRCKATSLAAESGEEISAPRLAAALIAKMDEMTAAFPTETAAYLEEYRAANVTTGREVIVRAPSGDRPAVALGINDDFSLRVRYENGEEQTVFTGEVAVRGLYGE